MLFLSLFKSSTDFFSDFGKDLEDLFGKQDEQREAQEQAEREAREARGLQTSDVAQALKITQRQIEAMERESTVVASRWLNAVAGAGSVRSSAGT